MGCGEGPHLSIASLVGPALFSQRSPELLGKGVGERKALSLIQFP